MNSRQIRIILFMVPALLLFHPAMAWAYIDPGTGSMVIQAIFSVVAAAGIYLGLSWRKVKSFFQKKNGKTDKTDQNSNGN